MPIPLPSATLAEVCAPLPIVRRLLVENRGASSTAFVSDYFRRALDGKWDQVLRLHPRAPRCSVHAPAGRSECPSHLCRRAQVPLLNDVEAVEQLQPGSLVRFRCMAQ